jgi:hypothetical protein
MCFNYPADVPPGTSSRDAAQPAPRGQSGMGYPCFSYPLICFSYPDVPQGIRNREAGQRTLPGLRRMPFTCFRY